jgi:hypothetical protein
VSPSQRSSGPSGWWPRGGPSLRSTPPNGGGARWSFERGDSCWPPSPPAAGRARGGQQVAKEEPGPHPRPRRQDELCRREEAHPGDPVVGRRGEPMAQGGHGRQQCTEGEEPGEPPFVPMDGQAQGYHEEPGQHGGAVGIQQLTAHELPQELQGAELHLGGGPLGRAAEGVVVDEDREPGEGGGRTGHGRQHHAARPRRSAGERLHPGSTATLIASGSAMNGWQSPTARPWTSTAARPRPVPRSRWAWATARG